MCHHRTHFVRREALARLPWFALKNGRLVLDDPSVGPIIDVHTHLALTFLRRRSVALFARPRPTEHYLPAERPLDLDVYCNRNFSSEDLARLKLDLGLRFASSRGMRATHTVPNLLTEMAELGITCSLLLPIDLPGLSSNAEIYLSAARRSPALQSLGSVHPFDFDVPGRLERQARLGALGVKIHPAVQMIRPDHPRALQLYAHCADFDLPVLFHCGPVGIEGVRARERCQLAHYYRAVREHPRTRFVLGHAGALQMEQALELAVSFPNVYLEVSCQSLGNLRWILAEAPIERVLFGSDWPFYHQSIGLAKILMATEGRPYVRSQVLAENATRLFKLQPATLEAS